jgi:hypothetical protein
MNNEKKDMLPQDGVSRRCVLGMGFDGFPEMVSAHLRLDRNAIQNIPAEKVEILPR